MMDAEFVGAVAPDLGLWEPIVHEALHEHVAQAVDVGVCQAVIGDLVSVADRIAWVVGAGSIHPMLEWGAVVAGGRFFEGASQGHADALADEAGGELSFGGGDQTGGSQFVGGPPSTPV